MQEAERKSEPEEKALKSAKATAYLSGWIEGSNRQLRSSESVYGSDTSQLEERFKKEELKETRLSQEALAEVLKELKRGYEDGAIEVLKHKTYELLDY